MTKGDEFDYYYYFFFSITSESNSILLVSIIWTQNIKTYRNIFSIVSHMFSFLLKRIECMFSVHAIKSVYEFLEAKQTFILLFFAYSSLHQSIFLFSLLKLMKHVYFSLSQQPNRMTIHFTYLWFIYGISAKINLNLLFVNNK